MGISDLIAEFIQQALAEENGTTELQRSELAGKFNCVPSQINYVISTRFSPERGYIVESRRGGGGYIRISRVRMGPQALAMHTINAIGSSIDLQSAAALISNAASGGAIDDKTAHMMLAAIGNQALRPVPPSERGIVRASILKQMLLKTIQ
ncbi:MAG: CtsR family transcriptional regulator [Ruminococcaceae bacterium]|nr:CtsR family transcriptional regulator [Oscillospiraceae bacterium]